MGANVQVPAGTPLVRVDAVRRGGHRGPGRVDRPGAAGGGDGGTAPAAGRRGAALRAAGLRVRAVGGRWLLDRYREETAGKPLDDPSAEIELLDLFADLCALSRNRRADAAETDESAHNEREHLLTYLGSLDVARERVPPTFEPKLRRALAHYGVTSLDRSPELKSALYRLYLALERAGTNVPVVEAVLGRLDDADPTEDVRRSPRPPHRRDPAALPPPRRAGPHDPVRDVRRPGAGGAPGRGLRAGDVAARAARRACRSRPGGVDGPSS